MEQQTSFIQQTYTYLLVQAHARSRMTRARRHAYMKTHTNPSSGLDGTTNSIHSTQRHTHT